VDIITILKRRFTAMKRINKLIVYTLILSTLFSFNVFAMNNKNTGEVEWPTPQNEKTYEDETLNKKWTWLSDELCVQFYKGYDKSLIEKWYNRGLVTVWGEKRDGVYQRKTRDTYSGKWLQSSEGIWSFEFDDKTIPVGATKIDGVLYAFTGYGELKDGYEYYTGLKTAADGLVKADSAEFTQWIATQYLPDCTSHE
jgi:hypothetical protein